MSTTETLARLPRGHITTIAGVGYRDGIPAREADAGWPVGVVRRPIGDLIVCDYLCHRVWRIDTDGILHTLCRRTASPAIRATAARQARPASAPRTTWRRTSRATSTSTT